MGSAATVSGIIYFAIRYANPTIPDNNYNLIFTDINSNRVRKYNPITSKFSNKVIKKNVNNIKKKSDRNCFNNCWIDRRWFSRWFIFNCKV